MTYPWCCSEAVGQWQAICGSDGASFTLTVLNCSEFRLLRKLNSVENTFTGAFELGNDELVTFWVKSITPQPTAALTPRRALATSGGGKVGC